MLQKTNHSFLIILLLIISGEAVFVLPFVLARIFRPTFLEVFQLNNLQIGSCFSIFGIVALASYIYGGALADKYQPRFLMSAALILTALGGFYLSTYPSYNSMKILYGYWGFTTIFLFWAAMIKATRVWGGTNNQGIAFGFLDGGRGLVAATFGTLGVFIFSIFLSVNINDATFIDKKVAFRYVIIFSSIVIMIIGVLVFFFLKLAPTTKHKRTNVLSLDQIKAVLKLPSVLLLMVIILCAYVGYKMTDFFSQYANEVMLYDDIKSAKIGTYLLYLRPFIGAGIGLLADKTKATLMLVIGFTLMFLSSLVFSSNLINENTVALFIISIGLMALAVYSARVLYFAAMQEGHIPLALTGTAVGVMSVIGFTPDIFMGPLTGVLLDNSPGKLGYQHIFMVLSVFALIGLLASLWFYRISVKRNS